MGLKNSSECLGELFGDLNRAGIDYRVVGGVARRAYTGEPLGENWNDVDIIFSDQAKNSPTLIKSKDEIWAKFHSRGITLDTFLSDSSISFNSKQVRLKVLGEETVLPGQLFERRIVNVNGIEFSTVDAIVLLHISGLMGKMRRKDWGNTLKLARYLKQNNGHFSEREFVAWHDYARSSREKHPATYVIKDIKIRVKEIIPEQFIPVLRPITKPIIEFALFCGKTIDSWKSTILTPALHKL